MKKINYYVIGGQYVSYCYGGTPTLIGAKRLASKSAEYWDNWQGWHIPDIYKAEDVEDVKMVFYESRYKAYKDKNSEHTVRKVDGGWMLMTWAEFEVWKNQK